MIKNKKGFTLIELLVVIAIIGLLSTMAVYAFNLARVEARDARRKADLRQLAKAIDLFYDATGSYPPAEAPNPDASISGGSYWGSSSAFVVTSLGHSMSEFIKPIPIDPINNATYSYVYEPHCGLGNTKQGYTLYATLEKTSNRFYIREGPQGGSPCPECDVCW
jgi:prepilin-type N-terminal cleavage/methylation domain-containing protein